LKKKASGASLVLVLLLSSVVGTCLVDLVKANPIAPLHLPQITINSDGSISPANSYIYRTGNTYTLTADIVEEYSIEIRCSNIVFDGMGHMIDVVVNDKFHDDNGNPGIYMDVGIHLIDAHNVIIKNVKVLASNIINIYLQDSSNCQIIGVTTGKNVRIRGDFNTIADSNCGVSIFDGSTNLITRNNVTFVFVGTGYSNRFFQNNFYLSDYPDLFTESVWDDGFVGNFWSDYQSKYPNASEIGNTGIGDTSYVIDSDNVDRYPLMCPWGVPVISVFGLENATYSGSVPLNFSVSKSTVWMGYSLDGGENVTVAGNFTLNDLVTGFHNLTVYANDSFENVGASETVVFTVVSEPFPFVPIALVFIVSIAVVVAVGLLVYHKKHKDRLVKKP
jgi:nitrous oxidase accessory protein NosD